jgi:hypothetical protein
LFGTLVNHLVHHSDTLVNHLVRHSSPQIVARNKKELTRSRESHAGVVPFFYTAGSMFAFGNTSAFGGGSRGKSPRGSLPLPCSAAAIANGSRVAVDLIAKPRLAVQRRGNTRSSTGSWMRNP